MGEVSSLCGAEVPALEGPAHSSGKPGRIHKNILPGHRASTEPIKTALLTAPRLRNAVVFPDNRVSGLAAVRPEPRASRVPELTR